MSPRLTLICHAATPALRAGAFPLDEALDEKGQAAARALGGRFARTSSAFTSPALRARQTAAALGLGAEPVEALRECDYGRWGGKSLEEIAVAEPQALAAWSTDPDAAPPGGESVAALIRRVAAWLRETSFAGHVVAVTHASVARAAVVHALGADARCFWRIEAGPLAMVDLRPSARGWSLRLG